MCHESWRMAATASHARRTSTLSSRPHKNNIMNSRHSMSRLREEEKKPRIANEFFSEGKVQSTTGVQRITRSTVGKWRCLCQERLAAFAASMTEGFMLFAHEKNNNARLNSRHVLRQQSFARFILIPLLTTIIDCRIRQHPEVFLPS